MRKVLLLVMVSLLIAGLLPLAKAQSSDKKFEVTGEFRVRYDRLDNYFDFNDDEDDLFSFWPYRARVGVTGQLANDVRVVLEVQNFGSWGNQSPVQGLTFPPFQNFDGDGSTAGSRSGDTSLYQGFVALDKVGGSRLGLTFGRQEYQIDDDGLILGNEPFYNGIVYDGAKGVWNEDNWGVTGFYYVTAETNDPANGQFPKFTSDDSDMFGGVGWFNVGKDVKSTVDAYLIRFSDRDEESFRPSFLTLGGHWWRAVKTQDDAKTFGLDWSCEAAAQRGKATDPVTGERLDLAGYILSDSLGWNVPAGKVMHRFSGSFILQSGDDDITDSDIDGWIPLFPRTHDRFGDADFFDSNFGQNEASITAYNIGYDLTIKDGKHHFGARVWKFVPTEDQIESSFLGISEKVHVKDYGSEVDLAYDFMYSEHAWLSAGVAILTPDDGLAGVDGPDDKVTRAWGQVKVRF